MTYTDEQLAAMSNEQLVILATTKLDEASKDIALLRMENNKLRHENERLSRALNLFIGATPAPVVRELMARLEGRFP